MTEEQTEKALISDLELARLVRDMDKEKLPQRDLWLGVQRNILDHPQPTSRRDSNFWMPYAVAASLLVAVSALMLNLAQVQTRSPFTTDTVGFDQLHQEYVQVRNPMVEEFNRVNHTLDEKTMTELHRNLEILEQARKELEMQVRKNPENTRLMELLMKVHEQELDLLKQDFTRPSTSM